MNQVKKACKYVIQKIRRKSSEKNPQKMLADLYCKIEKSLQICMNPVKKACKYVIQRNREEKKLADLYCKSEKSLQICIANGKKTYGFVLHYKISGVLGG